MKARRKNINKNRKKINKGLLFLVLIVIPMFLYVFSFVGQGDKLRLSYEIADKINYISPTNTPTPTSIPKPTGFCLDVPILMYHHVQDLTQAKGQAVSPEIFEQHMQYLVSHGYRTIRADELVNAIVTHQELGRVIVITLDDGYDDNYSNAFPIARKYGITLNFMIPTGLLNNSGFMTWDQLKEIASAGNGVYNHTWSHYSLNAGNDEKITTEIVTAKQQLESNIGGNVNIFTYPYGGFSERVVNILRNNGFRAAFSTISGTLQCEGNIMTLFRTRVGNAPLSAYGIY